MSCDDCSKRERQLGQGVSLKRWFKKWGDWRGVAAAIKEDRRKHRRPWISIEGPDGGTPAGWLAVGQGEYDGDLRALARVLKAHDDRPIFLSFDHEVSNNLPDDQGRSWAKGFKRFHDVLDEKGALDKVALAPIVASWLFDPANPQDAAAWMRPGVLRRASFMGVDLYQSDNGRSFAQRLPQVDSWLARHGYPDMRIGLGEIGATDYFGNVSGPDLAEPVPALGGPQHRRRHRGVLLQLDGQLRPRCLLAARRGSRQAGRLPQVAQPAHLHLPSPVAATAATFATPSWRTRRRPARRPRPGTPALTSRAGAKPSPEGGPSRRIRAWKWITPRRWYSATLAYCTVATFPSRVAGTPTFRDRAPQGDGEPLPQLRCPPLPDQVGGVVVAARAQRLPEQRVVVAMSCDAGGGQAVPTHKWLAAANPGSAGAAVAVAVDASEGRGGGGDEDQGVVRDGGRDGLPAGDPGPDQLVGVGGVDTGAGRAHRGAAVPAPHVRHAQGLLGAGVGGQDLPGGGVERGGVARGGGRGRAVPDPRQRAATQSSNSPEPASYASSPSRRGDISGSSRGACSP